MRHILFLILLLSNANLLAGKIRLPEKISYSLLKEYDPSVSANGKYLTYTVESAGDENIWLLNLESKEKSQLTFHSGSDYAPCFLGNSRVMFVSRKGNSLGEIYVSDLKGRESEMIIGGRGYFDTPAASRDGRKIAYVYAENDSDINIYVYDPRKKEIVKGPSGIAPSFMPSGDSLIFVALRDGGQKGCLAIFSLIDSSLTLIEPGEGLNFNPAASPDGRNIIFERKSRDTDEDGELDLDDASDLLLYNLADESLKRLLPGFEYSKPTLSASGDMYVQSYDDVIYLISPEGLSEKESDYKRHYIICDSLIGLSFNRTDSIVAAIACYEAYNYYPDKCRDLLLESAMIYAAAGLYDLGLDILGGESDSSDLVFIYKSLLTEAKIRYQMSKNRNNLRERAKAFSIFGDLLRKENLPDSLAKEIYEYCINAYYLEKMYENGNALVAEGLEKYGKDRNFAAILERWNLKYTTITYPGDRGELVDLYIRLMEKYPLHISLDGLLVGDIIEIISEPGNENALEELENLRRYNSEHPFLAGEASLKLAEMLSKKNMNSLAEWRLNEIIDEYKETPELRFKAFRELFNLSLRNKELDNTASMLDSAFLYLDFMNERNIREPFRKKAAEFYSLLGYEALNNNSDKARNLFIKALNINPGNYIALQGLARTAYMDEDIDIENISGADFDEAKLKLLKALKNILLYENKSDVKYLREARKILSETISEFPSDILPYLAIGYADCLLEENANKVLGLYEEAIEYSTKGLSLQKSYRSFEYGFYLNMGEAYSGLRQYEEAFRYLHMAAEIDSAAGNNANFKMKYGECAFQIDSLEIAGRCFEKLLQEAMESGDEERKASYALKLGLINQTLGNFLASAEYYEMAKAFYNARKDHATKTEILTAQAYCLKMAGDNKSALQYAEEALGAYDKADYKAGMYDYRIKFILWPFGISIPLVELLPMKFGGSLYPVGFTAAAKKALIFDLINEGGGLMADIVLKRNQIEMLSNSGERENTVELWDNLGKEHSDIGYADSSRNAFEKACDLSMELENYNGAYIELLNWAEFAFANPGNSVGVKELNEIRNRALNLYKYVLPSYPNARANLKNVAGLTEYMTALIEAENIVLRDTSRVQDLLSELDRLADALMNRLLNARYHFREALVELTPGRYPDIEAGLLLNDAVTSLTLGDFGEYRLSIENARKSAVLSESARLYGAIAALDALSGTGGTKQASDSLAKIASVYENTPAGPSLINDLPILTIIYEQSIELCLEENDIYSALYYLESLKKMNLISKLNQARSTLCRSDRFKASLNLFNGLQNELVNLYSKKRRLEALERFGIAQLKEVNDEILKKRTQLLEIKQELNEIDPAAFSSLVFDVSSINSMVGKIPTDELCVVPQRTAAGIAIWFCRKDSVDCLRLNSPNEIMGNLLPRDLGEFKVTTVASLDELGDKIERLISGEYPAAIIRRAYSLSEAYSAEIGNIRRSDGVLIIRSGNFKLPDNIAMESKASVIAAGADLPGIDISDYGWLVFDGDLNVDRNNILLSFWGDDGADNDEKSQRRLFVKDLFNIKNDAFGVIFIGQMDGLKEVEKAVLMKAFENLGVSAVIEISNGIDGQNLSSRLTDFFNGLKTLSPMESYKQAFKSNTDINRRAEWAGTCYYGDRGWQRDKEELIFKNMFNQYVIIACQYYVGKNWRLAEKYFKLAIDISKKRNIETSKIPDILKKLLNIYENTETYDDRIKEYFEDYISIFNTAGDTLFSARLYSDIARVEYDKRNFEKAIEYSTILIERSHKLDGLSLRALGYAVRAESYLEIGKFDLAADDLNRAIDLFSSGGDERKAILLKLKIAEIYNSKEMLGDSKIILDSLEENIINYKEDEIYSIYLLQLSKYYVATFRSEYAKKHLAGLLNVDGLADEASLLLGRSNLMEGNLDSALAFALNARSLQKKEGDIRFAGRCHELLGDIYRIKGDGEKARTQYDLAINIMADFEYKAAFDILRYKRILSLDEGSRIKDSLYNDILMTSDSELVKNLCRYQLGYSAAVRNERNVSKNYFEGVLNGDSNPVMTYLNWRSQFRLSVLSTSEEKQNCLENAERIMEEYSVEPDYVRKIYGFYESRENCYESMADMFLERGGQNRAIDYLESAFSARISAHYFSAGEFDSTENRIVNEMFMQQNNRKALKILIDGIKSDKKYSGLWGNNRSSVEELRRNLKENESVLRFFQKEDGFVSAYIDKDTILVYKLDFDGKDLKQTIDKMSDLLSHQARADSVMERWYVELISPVGKFLENTEKILIIPDGIMYFFPFEALKMPGGDYLSELYTLRRHICLPPEFPAEVAEPAMPGLALDSGYDQNLRLAEYIAEPFLKPVNEEYAGIVFYSGRYPMSAHSNIINKGILFNVKPASTEHFQDLAIQAMMGMRDGNSGFVYPLWALPDEVKAEYYWRSLKNLADAKGFRNSFDAARAYLFGHYEGLPYFWGANVYVSLN